MCKLVVAAWWIGTIFLSIGCDSDKTERPVEPENISSTGTIKLEVSFVSWPAGSAKIAALQTIDKVTAYIYNSTGNLTTQTNLTISGQVATGRVSVPAQNDYRVVLAYFDGTIVRYMGEKTDVDVPSGGVVTAKIEAVFMGTEVSASSDSVAAGQSYLISWQSLPYVTGYQLEEALQSDFAGATVVFDGTDTVMTFAEKESNATYYYRARSNTPYGSGPWYRAASVFVGSDSSEGTIAIDTPVPPDEPPPQWHATGLNTGYQKVLEAAPLNANILYAIEGKEIFNAGVLKKTLDGGSNWAVFYDTLAYAFAIAPTNPDILMTSVSFGYGGSAIYKSANGGLRWISVYEIREGRITTMSFSADLNTIYMGAYGIPEFYVDDIGIHKTTNGGAAWSHILKDIHILCLVVNPENPDIVYAGAIKNPQSAAIEDGVYRSDDGGVNWTRVLDNRQVNALAIDWTNTSTIYAGTEGDGIFKSIDGGVNWLNINAGLTHKVIRAIAIDPVNTNVIYAGAWEGGVFKTTDGGENWANMNTGLINTYILSLAVDPINTNIVYAGTEGDGVFKWE